MDVNLILFVIFDMFRLINVQYILYLYGHFVLYLIELIILIDH
jgi:hypothetical protein